MATKKKTVAKKATVKPEATTILHNIVKLFEQETGGKPAQARVIDLIRWWEEEDKSNEPV